MSANLLYIGIEGGSTATKGVLLDSNYAELSFVELPICTNHWQVGYDECTSRLLTLIDQLLEKTGMQGLALTSIGLSLSGANEENGSSAEIEKKLMAARPNLMVEGRSPRVYNDLVAALETASDQGGVVIIAGTGSNCRLTTPSGKHFNCGGWGHMLGDDGSAYWIAQRATKTVIDHIDALRLADLDISSVKTLVFDHFGVTDCYGLIKPFYTDFAKSEVASLTVKISVKAAEGDPLCRQLFSDAGAALAAQIVAVAREVEPGAFPNGLKVVCMGSVWKSWSLLQKSFLETLLPVTNKFGGIELVRLRTHGCFGAASVAARDTGLTLNIRREELVDSLYKS